MIVTQSHSIRIPAFSKYLTYTALYQLEVILFMQDYTHDNLPTSFQNVFKVNRDVHGIYETRQAHLFYIPWTNPDLSTLSLPKNLEQLVCTIRC